MVIPKFALLFLLLFQSGLTSSFQCRNQFNIDYGSLDNFTDHMCLYCLDTMIVPESPVWKDAALVVNHWAIDIPHTGNVIHTPNGNHYLRYSELKEAVKNKKIDHHFVLKEFSNPFYINTFLDCCQDAYDCCRRMEENPRRESHHCPTQWDGWTCWESAPPGKEYQTCPDMTEYLFGYLPPRYARNNCVNQCDPDGQWHLRWNYYYKRFMGHADYSQCSHLKIP